MKTIQPLSERKNIYLCLAVVWTLLIAYLCLVSFSNLPKMRIHGVDKGVHFTFHFVFTLLWIFYLKAQDSITNTIYRKVFIASFLYGGAIEIAQGLFTTTRSADILDVLGNSSGSLSAILLLLLLRRYSNYN